MIKHTFVVLAYGDSPFLENCIESILKQTTKVGVIVSTSTPSEFIRHVAEKFNIPLLVNREKNGIAADWNFALDAVDSDYVTLAHQDDLYHPTYAESVAKLASAHPRCSIIFTDYAEIRSDAVVGVNINLLVKRLLIWLSYRGGCVVDSVSKKRCLISFGSPIACPSVTYNKRLLTGFEFSRDYQVNMDWDAWTRLSACEGGFGFIGEKLMYHRIHRDAETSKAIGDSRRAKEDADIFSRLWPKPIGRALAYMYSFSYRSNS